jgi:hypothetical protein
MSHCYQNKTDQDNDTFLEKIIIETAAIQNQAVDTVKQIVRDTMNSQVLNKWAEQTPVAMYLNHCLCPSCGFKPEKGLNLICNENCPDYRE